MTSVSVATYRCVAIEGSRPGPGGSAGPSGRYDTLVIEVHLDRTVAGRLSLSGQVMAGWLDWLGAGHQGRGDCAATAICEGYELAAPAIGPDNVLYLLHGARNETVGGSITAVAPDGEVRRGWPVELKRSGAEFWSVVVGSDGTVYALAVEPEANDKSSASILAIAPDSTVLSITTIIEP